MRGGSRNGCALKRTRIQELAYRLAQIDSIHIGLPVTACGRTETSRAEPAQQLGSQPRPSQVDPLQSLEYEESCPSLFELSGPLARGVKPHRAHALVMRPNLQSRPDAWATGRSVLTVDSLGACRPCSAAAKAPEDRRP